MAAIAQIAISSRPSGCMCRCAALFHGQVGASSHRQHSQTQYGSMLLSVFWFVFFVFLLTWAFSDVSSEKTLSGHRGVAASTRSWSSQLSLDGETFQCQGRRPFQECYYLYCAVSFVGATVNTGHFDNEFNLAGSESVNDLRVDNIKLQYNASYSQLDA